MISNLVSNPLCSLEHLVHDTFVNHLNNFIISINATAQRSFVIQRQPEFEYEYHGSADVQPNKNIPEPMSGMQILTDMLLNETGTGVCTSIFSDQLSSLHYLLNLHGFLNFPECVQECKIMLAHHLLNGDCMQYGHLCQTIDKEKCPDCTACRTVSLGFSQSSDITKMVVNLATKASAAEMCTDKLLILADSIGPSENLCDKDKRNKHHKLIYSLQKFSGQTEYRASAETAPYDVFHDLLFGIEQCNSGTLRAILAHHHVAVNSKTKRKDMINLILQHISDGHCWKNVTVGLEQAACEDVKQKADTGFDVSDCE